ncbi:hypothetical protein [Stella sp.]|uniref:hypothetical protein n=1 Tax=Stella sp. TaxID=2912054 RepID=UPI0035B3C16F
MATLAAGIRPEEIAAARGVRVSTVRTQVAQIFAKTGTAGQAAFVRLAASLAPLAQR